VAEVDRPVNVLALPRGPSVPELASVDVRRISTGGLLARAAYGALVTSATELRDAGTSTYSTRAISSADVAAAFGR
jgi:2-methylisocitrate lyase-like PEP mutase family enzyme